MTTTLSGTATSRSDATARPRHAGRRELAGNSASQFDRCQRERVLLVDIMKIMQIRKPGPSAEDLGLCFLRKFIGGTPEQWDESKPIEEDPDASTDLQPVLVSEQVWDSGGMDGGMEEEGQGNVWGRAHPLMSAAPI